MSEQLEQDILRQTKELEQEEHKRRERKEEKRIKIPIVIRRFSLITIGVVLLGGAISSMRYCADQAKLHHYEETATVIEKRIDYFSSGEKKYIFNVQLETSVGSRSGCCYPFEVTKDFFESIEENEKLTTEFNANISDGILHDQKLKKMIFKEAPSKKE